MKNQTKSAIFMALAVIVIIFAIVSVVYRNRPTCVTAVRFIPIVGDISNAQDKDSSATSSPEADEDTILSELQSAENDGSVKAIVLLIDSNGGDPEMAEEVADEITGHIHKPIYALIRGNGDSGAYWIASAANKIFAFQSSDIGSIGVTDSYVSDAKQNTNNGLQFIPIASGQFKDSGDPDKPVTQADKDYLMKGVMDEYDIFVSAVATNRHMTVPQVEALANGSSVLGSQALQDGLIDSTGGWDALWQQLDKDLSMQCYSVE